MKKKYRIINSPTLVTDKDGTKTYVPQYEVQVTFLKLWVTVKVFYDKEDPEYALRCAEELIDKLNEEI